MKVSSGDSLNAPRTEYLNNNSNKNKKHNVFQSKRTSQPYTVMVSMFPDQGLCGLNKVSSSMKNKTKQKSLLETVFQSH